MDHHEFARSLDRGLRSISRRNERSREARAAGVTRLAPYKHPRDVLAASDLSHDDKRATLAAWASDAWAVVSQPTLRDFPEAEGPVPLRDVLAALRALDETKPSMRPPAQAPERRAAIGRANGVPGNLMSSAGAERCPAAAISSSNA